MNNEGGEILKFNEKHRTLYMVLTTPIRLFKKDPITFICSLGGAITGTISLILHCIRQSA